MEEYANSRKSERAAAREQQRAIANERRAKQILAAYNKAHGLGGVDLKDKHKRRSHGHDARNLKALADREAANGIWVKGASSVHGGELWHFKTGVGEDKARAHSIIEEATALQVLVCRKLSRARLSP